MRSPVPPPKHEFLSQGTTISGTGLQHASSDPSVYPYPHVSPSQKPSVRLKLAPQSRLSYQFTEIRPGYEVMPLASLYVASTVDIHILREFTLMFLFVLFCLYQTQMDCRISILSSGIYFFIILRTLELGFSLIFSTYPRCSSPDHVCGKATIHGFSGSK